MRVVFLGTNGWYSNALGNTSCALLESEDFYVVLDAGDGIYKLEDYVKTEKPIVIFLSHLHLDHIIGFHVFNKFRFNQSIRIYGFAGTKERLKIISHPYTASFEEVPSKIEVHDLNEGRHNKPFPFICKLLLHADQCLGYRFELDGRIVSYCTDTGVCDNVYSLSEGADLFVTECSLKPGMSESGWPHLRPEDAANIAKKAGVGKLVLTHFDASLYKNVEDRKRAEVVARRIFPETLAAFDAMEILM